ncbi:UDP-glucuronic acid decarboxylase family protein [Kitasatospora sp. NPDC001683]
MSPDARAFRRIVVTGGAGFLGSHLCDRLMTEQAEAVVCVDNLLTGSSDNLTPLLADPRFTLLRRDVSEPIHVPGKVDLVLHFASPASPADYLRLPIHTLKAGSLGTLHALELAERKGARFVLASTSEIYGEPLVHPQPETYRGNVDAVGPRSVYDEAKRFAEALTTAYRTSSGVDTGIVRIFNTYGPRMRPYDGRAVPTFVRQALTGEQITVTGDGSQTRSLCYVDDMVDGILAFAASGHPGPVNLGTTEETSMLELARLIRDMTGCRAAIRFIDRPVDDPTVRRPDTTLARQSLHWSPETSLRQGLKATIAWFAAQLDTALPQASEQAAILPAGARSPGC